MTAEVEVVKKSQYFNSNLGGGGVGTGVREDEYVEYWKMPATLKWRIVYNSKPV